MTKTKDSEKIQVRINHGDGVDEVFLYRNVPSKPELYVNETRYASPGTYKEGEFTEATVEKKEEG